MRKNVKIYKYSNVLAAQNQAFKGASVARGVPGPGEGANGGRTGAGGVDPKLFFQIFFHLPSTSNPTLRQSVAQALAKCNNFVTF